MTYRPYERIDCSRDDMPDVEDPAMARVLSLLLQCAEQFAKECREEPRHERDLTRSGRLLCAVGIGTDEASGFLRALDSELVTLRPNGNFLVQGARACSANLHLVGREGDGVKLHTEVLVHATAYAELVIDHGWHPQRLVFDPFFANDALDLWGFATEPSGESWRDGDIVFAAEAKARVKGRDGLQSLLKAFEQLNANPCAAVPPGQRRKWEEALRLTVDHPVQLLLLADGARCWYSAGRTNGALELEPLD